MMYEKVIATLQEHCNQCPVGQAMHVLQDSFAIAGMGPWQPVPAEPIPPKPTRAAKSRLKPAQSVSGRGDPNRTEKPCNKCHVVKPLAEYDRVPKCRDGHAGTCMACTRLRRKGAYAPRSAYAIKMGLTASPKVPAPRECDVCGDEFKSLDTLLEHKKMRHS